MSQHHVVAVVFRTKKKKKSYGQEGYAALEREGGVDQAKASCSACMSALPQPPFFWVEIYTLFFLTLHLLPAPPGEDAMTGDTDKYLRPQDLRELGDDSLPQEGYMGFSIGARSAR